MADLMETFVDEARDLAKTLVDGLLAIEKAPDDPAPIEELFRAMHTLKGSSGIFDLAPLTGLAHRAEDLLDGHRASGAALTSEAVDALLGVTDQLMDWIDALAETGGLPPEAAEEAEAKGAALAALVGPSTAGAEDAPSAPAAEATAEETRDAILAALAAPGTVRRAGAAETTGGLAIRYRPKASVFFEGDDPMLTWSRLPGLDASRIVARAPWPAAADFDPYDCRLEFFGLSSAPREAVAHHLRYVLDDVVLVKIEAVAPAAEEERAAAPDAALAAMADEILAMQDAMVAWPGRTPAHQAGCEAAAARVRERLGVHGEAPARPAPVMPRSVVSAPEAAMPKAPPPKAPSPATAPTAAAKADTPTPHAAPKATREKAEPGTPRPSSIRIDESRLDVLMNLIGELVVAKNALPYLARRAREVHDCPGLSREITAQFAVVDRLAHEMQGEILRLRMLPISQVFDRFPRLVRDVARKLRKDIELEIAGAETEVDKSIVECLSDPLVHIVRNALDHGLETPEERRAFAKPETGRLRLSAHSAADQIVVEVSDDGRGIDAGRVKAKALERGLIDAEEAARMSEEEARALIFRAGFSTNDTVTDLSGRGVGMDAAITAITAVGGRLGLSSEVGRGTTVRIALPLSIAISRIVVVSIGEALYGIPMEYISEMIRVPRSAIRILQGREVFTLREEVVPLVRLDALFGTPSATEKTHEAIVVTAADNQSFGFVVDDLRERMETIVKPMDGVIAGLPGFVGTSLMGDGRVLLVINPEELFLARAA